MFKKLFQKTTQEDELFAALKRAASTGRLYAELESLPNHTIKTTEQATALCKFLAAFPFDWLSGEETKPSSSDLHQAVGLFQSAESQEAVDVLNANGIPELIRIFQNRASLPASENQTLLFLLKILAMYGGEDTTRVIADAINEGFEADGYLWSIILSIFGSDHPQALLLLKTTRVPQTNFLKIAYLDFANSLAIPGKIYKHPFDTDSGVSALRSWIESTDADEFSYARSAVAAIPYLSEANRNALLAIASKHPDNEVRIEAAWARAKTGDRAGLTTLSELAASAQTSALAVRYLEELGASDWIPPEAQNPDFKAVAEMADWLSHPNEIGRSPNRISLALKRDMFWPPTNDRRTMRVIRYEYDGEADNPDQKREVGYGLVGSVTFALFGETTEELSPDDVLALHCCWEMEMNSDPRAPKERTVHACQQILRQYNS